MQLVSGLKILFRLNDFTSLIEKGIIIGIYLVLPKQAREINLSISKPKIQLLNAMLAYLISLNDQLDFAGSKRKEISGLVKQAYRLKLKHYLHLQKLLKKQNKGYSALVDEASKEVIFLEEYIRNQKKVTAFQIILYRSLVNIIENILIVGLLFNQQDLLQHFKQANLNFNQLQQKYKWVLNAKTKNEYDKAIIILYNLAMSVQIDDDWYGQEIDALLNVPNLTQAALLQTKNLKLAHLLMKSWQSNYRQQIISLKFNGFYLWLITKFWLISEYLNARISKYIRERPDSFWRRIVINKLSPVREKAYMLKQF